MSKNSKPVLEVKNLTKKFKDVVAVDNISFKMGEGEIVGLLGPNGAGKTTTIQMLLSVLTPTSGNIKYFGLDFEKNREEILKKVNFCSSYIKLPWRMTVWENLDGHFYCDSNLRCLLSGFNIAGLGSKSSSFDAHELHF